VYSNAGTSQIACQLSMLCIEHILCH